MTKNEFISKINKIGTENNLQVSILEPSLSSPNYHASLMDSIPGKPVYRFCVQVKFTEERGMWIYDIRAMKKVENDANRIVKLIMA